MPRVSTVSVLEPEMWVDAHGDCLYRYALVRVRTPETAEELVQQTLLAALKGRDSFKGDSSERTWLIAILKRKVVDWLRLNLRQRSRQEMSTDEASNRLFGRIGDWKKQPDEWSFDNPGRDICKTEFRETLNGCLDKLPHRLRQAFVLTYIDEETTEDIRRSVNVTATNLAVMLHRARLRLWHCMSVNWFGEDPETISRGRRD